MLFQVIVRNLRGVVDILLFFLCVCGLRSGRRHYSESTDISEFDSSTSSPREEESSIEETSITDTSVSVSVSLGMGSSAS